METFAQEKKQRLTAAEYLEREATAEHKSEFYGGEVVAMAGAQEPHNAIVANLIAELVFCLKKRGCRVYPSDQMLSLPDCERYVYPDISVVCAPPKLEKHKGLDALLNPVLLVEVLSESTAQRDKSDKLDCYLSLDSLQEYALIDSREQQVSVYRRTDAHNWNLRILDENTQNIELAGCTIALTDIYRNVFE